MRPYMTEEEAGKKFCPIADCGEDGNRAMNGIPQDYNRCLGSVCMWWGWRPIVANDTSDGAELSERIGRCEAPGGPHG